MDKTFGIVSVVALAAVLAVAYCARDTVLVSTDSPFGLVTVTEDRRGIRSLYFDDGDARQGAAEPGNYTSLEIPYMRVASIGLALPRALESVLFVGLGVGAMPMLAHTIFPEASVEVVEINPVVLDVAREYFHLTPDNRLHVSIDDGRAFVEQRPASTYDVVVLDAYSDDGIPEHLATREFLIAVRNTLTAGGLVVSNLWTANARFQDMLATFDDVFAHLAVVTVPRRAQVILFASNADVLSRSTLREAALRLDALMHPTYESAALVERGFERPTMEAGQVIRDAVAPSR